MITINKLRCKTISFRKNSYLDKCMVIWKQWLSPENTITVFFYTIFSTVGPRIRQINFSASVKQWPYGKREVIQTQSKITTVGLY